MQSCGKTSKSEVFNPKKKSSFKTSWDNTRHPTSYYFRVGYITKLWRLTGDIMELQQKAIEHAKSDTRRPSNANKDSRGKGGYLKQKKPKS
jgi:hypothetical protein